MISADSAIFTIHVLAGAAFGVTVPLMQLVVNPAMAKIPAGEPKALAAAVIQSRARVAVDIIILIQILTALYLLAARWSMIGQSPWLMAKITLGATALVIAGLLHFYWRGKKTRLKAQGKDEEFSALSAWTMKMEKIVLVTVPATWIMGVIWSHL